MGAELRRLAADLAPCLSSLYRAYGAGRYLTAADSVSARVPVSHRPRLPTLIRLDVIDTGDECKVIEVNAGNCAGIELCAQIHGYLQPRLLPAAPTTLPGVAYLTDVVTSAPNGAVCVYLEDEQCRALALVRRALMQQVDPTIAVEVLQARDVTGNGASIRADVLFFREFMYDDLDRRRGDHAALEQLLLALPAHRQFPSLCDEFLADKSYIAAVDMLVRSGRAGATDLSAAEAACWMRWMAPMLVMRDDVRGPTALTFPAPDGVVVKPAHGHGGRGVVRVERLADARFEAEDRHVIQPFYRTTPHFFTPLRGGRRPMHVVYGIFLLPRGEALRYGGTFVRFAPRPIVDHTADVALCCEPDW